jgi:hypothetical protein
LTPDTAPARHRSCGPDVAKTLNDLGAIDGNQNRLDDARHHYEEALKIRKTLAQENPDAYLPDVAETLNKLGED